MAFDDKFLETLIVGIGEVSQITGIPTRQIRYWEDKGIVTSLTKGEGKNRRYNYINIKKMLLIKELIDEGYTLETANLKVVKRMEMIESTMNSLKSIQS